MSNKIALIKNQCDISNLEECDNSNLELRQQWS